MRQPPSYTPSWDHPKKASTRWRQVLFGAGTLARVRTPPMPRVWRECARHRGSFSCHPLKLRTKLCHIGLGGHGTRTLQLEQKHKSSIVKRSKRSQTSLSGPNTCSNVRLREYSKAIWALRCLRKQMAQGALRRVRRLVGPASRELRVLVRLCKVRKMLEHR